MENLEQIKSLDPQLTVRLTLKEQQKKKKNVI